MDCLNNTLDDLPRSSSRTINSIGGSDIFKNVDHLLGKLLSRLPSCYRQPVVFDQTPEVFNEIELGRIGRQQLNEDVLCLPLFYFFLHLTSRVKRSAVDHHHCFFSHPLADKIIEVGNEQLGIHRCLVIGALKVVIGGQKTSYSEHIAPLGG